MLDPLQNILWSMDGILQCQDLLRHRYRPDWRDAQIGELDHIANIHEQLIEIAKDQV